MRREKITRHQTDFIEWGDEMHNTSAAAGANRDDDIDRLMFFISRYAGNPSDHAQQNDDGGYTRMGRAITVDDARRHFAGLATLAVYPVRPGTHDCRFLAFDIDDGDRDTLTAITTALDEFGIGQDSRTVNDSGRKGWHVTVFPVDWMPAATVRRAGRAILDRAGNPKRVEMFPKQDAIEDGKQGNAIKLPEAWHRKARCWAHYLRDSRTWRNVNRVRCQDIERIAGQLAPPQPAPARRPWIAPAARGGRAFPGSLAQRTMLPPCMRTVLERGVPDGMRQRSIFGLALVLYSKGAPESAALQLAREANERCQPPLPDAEVRTQVGGAYSGRYRGLHCSADYLHDGPVTLCQSSCRSYRPEFGRAIGAMAS